MKISDVLGFLRAEGISFTFAGKETDIVEGFSSLQHYKSGSFTWIKKQKNIPEGFDLSQIALAFVSEEVDVGSAPCIIRTPESKHAFFATIEHFYAQEEERPAVGQFTYIAPTVSLGKGVRIGHNCTLDGDITIGDGTVIWNNVVIVNRVSIGKDCDIHSGAVIGHDSIAYTEDAEHKKTMVKHFGGVSIGDRVLIGESACVCRGTIDDTVLESGVKIGTMGIVSHNCHIGENTALLINTVLCGSVTVGRNSCLSGATILNQTKLGDGSHAGFRSVVLRNVAPGQQVFGYPARDFFFPKK